MRLQQLLDNLPRDRKLLISQSRQFTCHDFSSLVADLIPMRPPIGSRVTLACDDTVRNIAWMIALDGHAEAVFLAPDSLRNSAEFSDFIEKSGCRTVIAEAGPSAQQEVRTGEVSGGGEPVTKWLLATSGTTGIPKLIEHTTVSLTRTVKTNTEKGSEFCWALVYDPFRFAGLQVLLQSIASGSNLLICNDDELARQASLIREFNVNALSATPTFWRKLLMAGNLQGHPFRQITLGGEPSDQLILNSLAKAFPEARLSHIYASTEAGVGFSVTDGQEGFPARYLREGINGNHMRIGAAGTLEIKPVGAASQLLGGKSLADEQGFIDTGDMVTERNDRVYFLGRLSGAINVGGNKVMPEEVEAVIRSVPGVAQTLVKGKGSAVMGQLIVAEIVPADTTIDEAELKKAILIACREKLERYKVPALIKLVQELQHSATGKLIRSE